MRETIVVLAPDSRCQEDIQGCNLLSPLDLQTLLNPFAVLIDHTVNDMDERFIAVEQAMSS